MKRQISFQTLSRQIRRYATPKSQTSPLAASSALNVFDTRAKRLQRERAAYDTEFSRITDYLRDEVAGVMVDRLLVCLLQKVDLGLKNVIFYRI